LHFIEESDRLIRMMAAVMKDSSGMRVAGLRRRLKVLKRIEEESAHLVAALEIFKGKATNRSPKILA